MADSKAYIPITPGGTVLFALAARTEEGAWANLMDAPPGSIYGSIEAVRNRGYELGTVDADDATMCYWKELDC